MPRHPLEELVRDALHGGRAVAMIVSPAAMSGPRRGRGVNVTAARELGLRVSAEGAHAGAVPPGGASTCAHLLRLLSDRRADG